MKSWNRSTGERRGWIRRRGLPLALIVGAVIVLRADSCSKESSYFFPFGLSSGQSDNSGPLITSFLPGAGLILNDVVVMSTITDPQGSNGATPSGVDASSITATGNDGADLAVTMSGTNMYNADIASWGDGLHMIDWSAFDFAGNEGTATQTITIDRTAPEVTVNPAPPATASSADASFSWTVGVQIVEPHFLSATYNLTLAGADEECGTGDDVTPTSAQAPTSSFPLQAGTNTVDVVTNNGLSPGDDPHTAIYCGRVTALDAGVLKTGASAPNTTTTTPFRTDLTWMAPPGGGGFNISLGNPPPGYCHNGPGNTTPYTGFDTSPVQALASYSISWSGPGTVGTTSRSGSLDASGHGFDQQLVNQFGLYAFQLTVNAGGVTEMASGTIDVTAAQGACAQASSRRYKREIRALLPADVRPFGLNPVAFRYREPWGDPAEPRIGLIAEEVAEVFPEAVTRDDQGRPGAILYGVLGRRVVEEAVGRAGHAIEEAIARLPGAF